MACQLCMLTSCLCHPYPGQSHGSSQLVLGLGQPIRAKKTSGTRGGRLHAWTTTSSARVAMSDIRFRCRFHQCDRLFLFYTVVWSKHHFDNFHFWAKIKHHFKPCALIPIVRNSDSYARTGDVLIVTHCRLSTLRHNI